MHAWSSSTPPLVGFDSVDSRSAQVIRTSTGIKKAVDFRARAAGRAAARAAGGAVQSGGQGTIIFSKALRRTPPLAHVLSERRWRWSDWIYRSFPLQN